MQPIKHVPLCLTRIWCRRNEAWLSFKTVTQDRFLVNPDGYFIELPDGSLSRISPRTTFPVINRFPALILSQIMPRKQFGDEAYFISVPLRTQTRQDPGMVSVEQINQDPLAGIHLGRPLDELERYLVLRIIENGNIPPSELSKLLSMREQSGKSFGEIIISTNTCHWESLLAQCLDIRPPSRLDPPSLRTIIERREWELIGEVLVSLDKINRTELEHALKVKREGNQALGQILTVMGACKKEDIQRCLQIQETLKLADHEGVVLIGKLLVSQGIISDSDLEDVLWKQRVARQPLGRILVSMGACSQREIDYYESMHTDRFQQSVDEAAMGNYLVKTDTITKTQLEEAYRIQQRGRQVLGEMLVSMGLCSKDDVETVISLQHDVRDAYRSGVQRLGDLLIRKGKVPAQMVDEALKVQSIGRQPFGAILVAMGACSSQDVELALEVQRKWRSRPRHAGDRLGEVLVKHKILTEKQLEDPLLQHMREEKPLGRILVERALVRPELIIGALIDRDNTRQDEFLQYVRSHIPGAQAQPATTERAPGDVPPQSSRGKNSGAKFAALFSVLKKTDQK